MSFLATQLIGFGARRSGFSPADISPTAWWDPSDLSTMWQDSGGTTPVAADGDPVGKIADKSGNNYHLTQATSSKRPLYKTSGGLSWLQFDGVDDEMDNTSFTYSGSNTFYAALAAKVSSGANAWERMLSIFKGAAGADHADAGSAALVLRISSDQTFGAYRDSTQLQTASITNDTDYVFESLFDGTNASFRLNNNSASTTAWNANFDIDRIRLARNTESSTNFLGRVYGVFVKQTVPAAGEATSLRTWLGAKAGLTI